MLSLNSTSGQIEVDNNSAGISNLDSSILQQEIEHKLNIADTTNGDLFEMGYLNDDLESYYNDTFDTAQVLGSVRENGLSEESIIRLHGYLDGYKTSDMVDYYGVALMGGQTISIDLSGFEYTDEEGFSYGDYGYLLNVGVYDQEGRLVATDYSDIESGQFQGAEFTFTAAEPGLYRIAIAFVGDGNFNGTTDSGESTTVLIGEAHYELVIKGVGDLAVGGIVSREHLFGEFESSSTIVRNGDLGAIWVTDTQFYRWGNAYTNGNNNIQIRRGDLRADIAGSIGSDDVEDRIGLNIEVEDGNVGLIMSTVGDLNLDYADVAGDIQLIDGFETVYVNLHADGGLGVIRAGDMDTDIASTISVNEDNLNQDGIIDLIDVVGDFGSSLAGGPQISTGLGGNVRYIQVGGDVYQDLYFGSGDPVIQTFDEGESVTVYDDSGAEITISPTDVTQQYDELNRAVTLANLELVAYGIRSSGGKVIISVKSSGGMNINAVSNGVGNTAEIGTIIVEGEGIPVEDPDEISTGTGTGSTGGTSDDDTSDDPGDLNVIINTTDGTRVDVWMVTGAQVDFVDSDGTSAALTVGEGDFNLIANYTGGDIINVSAASIDTLNSFGSIGLVTGTTGSAVNPRTTINDTYPFLKQHIGIVSGNIANIYANEAIGNVMVDGYIGLIYANHDLVNQVDTFEGIAGPIYASGDIYYINIGEGLASTGNGEVAQSGIFAEGFIFTIVNQGEGSDIFGNIVSEEGIGSITLTNGVIANSNIMVISDLEDSLEWLTPSINTSDVDEPEVPDYGGLSTADKAILQAQYNREVTRYNANGGIYSISTTAKGGILGTVIIGNQINTISVDGGFGLLNSVISINEGNDITLLDIDGYGIRDVVFDGVTSIDTIRLETAARYIDPTLFGLGARPSMQVDGTANTLTDLLYYLADSNGMDIAEFMEMVSDINNGVDIADIANLGYYGNYQDSGIGADIPDVLQAGILGSVDMRGSHNLGTLTAYQIRSDNETDTAYSYIVFANHIGTITVTDIVKGLNLTTGGLDSMTIGSDLINSELHVAGEVTNFKVSGDFQADSSLTLDGYNGYLNSFTVTGDMDGQLVVAGSVNNIDIDGDLNGWIQIEGSQSNIVALNKIDVASSLSSDNFYVDGDVNTIYVGDDASGSMTITGNLGTMEVGRNSTGGDMLMDLIVQGNLGTLTANGVISGDVHVYGNVTSKIQATRVSDDIGALLGDSFTHVVDLTAFSDSLMYVVNETAGGLFELYTITRNANGTLNAVSRKGTLADSGVALTDVQAIEVDPNDSTKLYVVANDGSGNLALYTIDVTTGSTVGNEFDLGIAVANDQYSSLAFVGSNLYMVNSALTIPAGVYVNQLYKINIAGSTATSQGPINLPDNGYDDTKQYIAAMDTDADGNFRIYVADSTDSENGSIIELSDPIVNGFAITSLVNGFVFATDFSNPNAFGNAWSGTGTGFTGNINNSLFIPANSSFSASNFDTTVVLPLGTISNATGYTSDSNGYFYQINDNASGTADVLYQTESADSIKAQYGLSLITGNVVVHGYLNNITASKGHITGNVLAGGNINTVAVTDGSLGLDETITLSSSFGNIGTVTVTRGNVNAQVIASNGSITSFTTVDSTTSTAPQVNGDLLMGTSIQARQLLAATIGGNIESGVTITSEHQTNTFNVTGNVEDGVMVTLGDLTSSTIGGNFDGDLRVNAINGTRPVVTINGNMDGTASFADSATLTIKGDFGTDSASLARLDINGNASVTIQGDMHGDLVVGSRLESLIADNYYDANVFVGGRINSISTTNTTTGNVADSVFQAGLSAGNDGIFAETSSQADVFEGGTLEKIVSFIAGNIANSIIAAGHDIDTFRANTSISNSTVVSGFVLGHEAAAALLKSSNKTDFAALSDDMADLMKVDSRTLYYGDLGTVYLGTSASNVDVIAGVDVGADGVYGTNDDSIIHISNNGVIQGGGISTITSVSGGGAGATGYIAADSKITSNTSSIATTAVLNPNAANYMDMLGVTIVDINNNVITLNDVIADALHTTKLSGTTNTQLTTGNNSYVKVQKNGLDEVYIYDLDTSDNFIDAIFVVRGATNTAFSQTSLTIQYSDGSGLTDGIQIGQILTSDDVKLGNLDFYNLNGTTGTLVLAGDSDSSTPDLWIDATNEASLIRPTSTVHQDALQVAANFTGYISGNVSTLSLGTIDPSARINIAGDVNYMLVMSSDTGENNTVSYTVDTAATNSITLAANETTDGYQFYTVSSTGDYAAYYYIVEITTTVDGVDTLTYEGRIDVYDHSGPVTSVTTYTGLATNITGLEYDDDVNNTLFAMTTDSSYLPSNEVLTGLDTSDYEGLAINSEGRAFAIDYNIGGDGLAHLVEIDATNGIVRDMGIIRDVLGLTYNQSATYGSDIVQIAFDAQDNLILISRDNGNGADVTAQYVMMQIDSDEIDSGDTYLSAHSPSSAVLARRTITNLSTGLELQGLAYNSEDGYFYVAAYDSNSKVNFIYRFSKTSPTATAVVTSDADSSTLMGATTINGIGFDADHNLVIQFVDTTSGLASLYVTDIVTTTTTNALTNVTTTTVSYELEQVSTDGAVDDTVDAFAIGLVDGTEIAFAYSVDQSNNGSIFQSAKAGSTTTLIGSIELNNTDMTAQFLQSASLLLGSAQSGSSMTIDAANDLAYVVTVGDNPNLWVVDLTTNMVSKIGQLTMTNGGDLAQIGGIAFDANGSLIGVDTQLRRIVSIDTATASVTARTEAGTVNSALTDLSYDSNSATITGIADGEVVTFFATSMDMLGGIVAHRIYAGDVNVVNYASSTGRETFEGRIVSNGSDTNIRAFEVLYIRGDFAGVISSNNTINSIQVISSDFDGSVVGEDINEFNQIGNTTQWEDFTENAVIDINDYAGVLIFGGDMDGYVSSRRNAYLNVYEAVGTEGRIVVDYLLTEFAVGTTFDGTIDVAKMNYFSILDTVLDNANIFIDGDMITLYIGDGTETNSMIRVNGDVGSINIDGTAQGTISIFGAVTTSQFEELDGAIYNVALGGTTLQISGTTEQSYLLYGVWLGEDGLLNTEDDVITGGSLTTATIETMRDTVLAAGVLPSAKRGEIDRDDFNAYYFQDHTEDGVYYSVESGGILPSSIGTVTVDQASNTNETIGLFNLVVATDSVPDSISGTQNAVIRRQTYNDLPGGPQVVSVTQTSDSIIEIVFNEELNANTISLTTSDNPFGSITLQDFVSEQTLIEDVEIEYVTRTNAAGQKVGVIRLKSTNFDGFSPLVKITISDGSDGHEALLDRSGTSLGAGYGRWSRSALGDFNQDGLTDNFEGVIDDLAGTVIDGDADGKSGGIFETYVLGDNSEGYEFLSALLDQTDLDVNEETTIEGTFSEYGGDPFVMSFYANEGQFFSYNYQSLDYSNAVIGLFIQDDQGTESVADDTFELVARYESSEYTFDEDGYITGASGFQALQLPESGNYFLVVDSQYFYYNDLYTEDYIYESEFELTVGLYTNADLIDVPVDENGDPTDEVAYTPGTENNAAKQLIYLNFEGGLATGYEDYYGNPVSYDVAAFDIEDLGYAPYLSYYNDDYEAYTDEELAAINDELIALITQKVYDLYANALLGDTYLLTGNATDGYTYSTDNATDGIAKDSDIDGDGTNDTADMAAASLFFDIFNLNDYGIYFTTIDPSTFTDGNVQALEYTEIYIGQTTDADTGYGTNNFGEATDVDLLNMDKTGAAYVALQNFYTDFDRYVDGTASYASELADMSTFIANVTGHELGHLLGLNHTNILPVDDGTVTAESLGDSWYNIMSSGSAFTGSEYYTPWQFGTSDVWDGNHYVYDYYIYSGEFSIGQIDTLDLLVRWFGTPS
jgi:hypothetical protein